MTRDLRIPPLQSACCGSGLRFDARLNRMDSARGRNLLFWVIWALDLKLGSFFIIYHFHFVYYIPTIPIGI